MSNKAPAVLLDPRGWNAQRARLSCPAGSGEDDEKRIDEEKVTDAVCAASSRAQRRERRAAARPRPQPGAGREIERSREAEASAAPAVRTTGGVVIREPPGRVVPTVVRRGCSRLSVEQHVRPAPRIVQKRQRRCDRRFRQRRGLGPRPEGDRPPAAVRCSRHDREPKSGVQGASATRMTARRPRTPGRADRGSRDTEALRHWMFSASARAMKQS